MIFGILANYLNVNMDWINIDNPTLVFVISVIWGLGLAALLKPNLDRCVVYRAPDLEGDSNQEWKFDDKCYTFHPKASHC